MSYNLFEFLAGLLGEPSENLNEMEEPNINILDHFTLCDFTITITLKGLRHLRFLNGKIQQQFDIIAKLIDTIIVPYCNQYLFNIELHKCGEWIHSHGIIQMHHRSKVDKLRKEIYFFLEKKPLKRGLTYKPRILIEKVYNLENWNNYLFKDYTTYASLKREFPRIKYKYRLNKISHSYICPPLGGLPVLYVKDNAPQQCQNV